LFGAFKWPLVGAGVTLALILIWSIWPAAVLSADSFELVDDIDAPVPAELILDASRSCRSGTNVDRRQTHRDQRHRAVAERSGSRRRRHHVRGR
jgi:hypothetical protein